MRKTYSDISDKILAEDYRVLHRELMDIKSEMKERGYTSQTFTRLNGQTARIELHGYTMPAQTETIRFNKTKVETISV